MSKDAYSGGLFSRVVNFVRHPATSWGDLDTVSDQRDQHSKQALKEMIERKRRNDFVRKREFDMLRRLRAKGSGADPGQRGTPSFFQSTFDSRPDDRAGMLKKIDDIEAHMSMQWWKTKQQDREGNTIQAPHSAGVTVRPHRSDHMDTTLAYGKIVSLQQQDATTLKMPLRFSLQKTEKSAEYATTQLLTRPHTVDATGSAAGADLQPVSLNGHSARVDVQSETGPTCPPELSEIQSELSIQSMPLTDSKFYALDAAQLVMDPEIEEAAIRYASGDEQGTEQGLLDVISRKGAGGTPDEWLALLDLYRATGKADKFEARALQFAKRFSRSAPQWFFMPVEAAIRMTKSDAVASQARPSWTADAEMDGHMLTMMSQMLDRVPPPWVLDWSELKSVNPAVIERLTHVFSGWAASSVELRFVGSEQLLNVLMDLTPSGRRDVSQACWGLRLAALRVMNLPDEFESVALDFCVTYEISPPAWDAPGCGFRDLSLEALGIAAAPELHDLGGVAPAGEDVLSSLDSSGAVGFQNASHGELIGELLGDPARSLQELDQLIGDAAVRVVSCKYLIRVDFAAAGAILNWAAAHQSQGRRVRFVDVNRLISAFFHVIGITEQADVVPRED